MLKHRVQLKCLRLGVTFSFLLLQLGREKTKGSLAETPGAEMLVPCLPSCQARLWGQSEGRKSRDGESSSRTRRNKGGTRGAEELISTPNPITGLVTPSHLLSLLGVMHRKSTRSDGSTAISRCIGNLALLTQTHAFHAMLWGFFLG